MKAIERALREKIGLDPASLGSRLIQRSVRLRMKSHGLKRTEEYERLLASSNGEWAELIESVVVAETWFFRDQEPFAALARLVVGEWLPANADGAVRILSVPCSSGEEPYSVAMALVDAGVAPERFRIDAVDISTRALALAARGIYGKNSFRGRNLEFRSRYFRATREGYSLDPVIRRCVRFQHGNLLSDDFRTAQSTYDYIFCRNLLIYFDRPTQEKALQRLEGLLAPAGALFVGPAEQPLPVQHGFVSADIAMAFACRKAARDGNGAGGRRPMPNTAALPQLAPTPPSDRPSALPRSHAPTVWPAANGLRRADLDEARRLADAGRLAEAAALCEAHLRESGASAPAYYLLGLVRDALADASAAECYRKALYLEPNHYESLMQLALWLQKNGETARARALKSRAQRVKLAN
jgi:chemotaxis protein methyltransferase WspC